MKEEKLQPGRLIQQGVGESDEAFQARLQAAANEEIRLERPASKSPLQVLEELQAQLAEKNLSEEDLKTLMDDPRTFLETRRGLTFGESQAITETVAKLYFRTLHMKAVEGEAFTKARLEEAMIQAQTRTLEAIAGTVQGCPDLNLILRVAQELTK